MPDALIYWASLIRPSVVFFYFHGFLSSSIANQRRFKVLLAQLRHLHLLTNNRA